MRGTNRWVGRLQIGFEQVDVPATYGQVAKIIAIYVKTSVCGPLPGIYASHGRSSTH